MNRSTILKHTDNATFEVVEGEAVLIDMSTGSYFTLNRVGTEFWEHIDGRQTIEQHADALARQYEVDLQTVTADLIDLAEKMAANNLVEEVHSPL